MNILWMFLPPAAILSLWQLFLCTIPNPENQFSLDAVPLLESMVAYVQRHLHKLRKAEMRSQSNLMLFILCVLFTLEVRC